MYHRFVATTYNLWQRTRWDDRKRALESYLMLARPDILCVQEIRPESQTLLDVTLDGHARVEDDFVGWNEEGNIYYSKELFVAVEHGAEWVGQKSPNRRLFWVRLKHRYSSRSILVATIHLTYQGTTLERTEGVSPRLEEIQGSIGRLESLAKDEEPVLFMGDLNDAVNVIRHLRDAGFVDSFTSSGSPLAPTHPVRPTAEGVPQTIDWQFHKGPVRSLGSYVGEYFLEDIAPSDHRPVTTTYGLGD